MVSTQSISWEVTTTKHITTSRVVGQPHVGDGSMAKGVYRLHPGHDTLYVIIRVRWIVCAQAPQKIVSGVD